MRTLTTVLLLSLIALVGCSGGEEVPATVEATDEADAPVGRIAFESCGRIFVMDADGGNQIQLTSDEDCSPYWSPDGSQIVFDSYRERYGGTIKDRNIFVMDADGGNLTQLTRGGGRRPAWSPDGNHILFSFYENGGCAIVVMNADGSNQTQLTFDGYRNICPAWSPDGSRIAFCSNGGGHEEIFVMDADGRNQTQLTYGDYGNGCFRGFSSLRWSPDGNQMTFVSCRDMETTSDEYNNYHSGHDEVFVMDADGGNLTQLTTEGNSRPAWSPDGSRIAFVSYRAGGLEIFVMDADGSNQAQLTSNAIPSCDSFSYIFWIPDGKHLVFTAGNQEDTYNTFIMGADGSNVTQLTTEGGYSPAWCPVTTSPITPAPAVHLLVIVDSLRLRDEPNTSSGEQVGLLEKDDTVEVLWRWENWAKVRTESDLDAWACVELDGETFLEPVK
jgi:Tol biopolymer transport system component